jgi:hypothetical protein
MQEVLVHVLMANIEGLDGHMQWPNEQHREESANQYTGIFHGCIGVAEFKDPIKECLLWSDKKKINR